MLQISDVLLPLEIRATQVRMGWKIDAKFRTFSSPVKIRGKMAKCPNAILNYNLGSNLVYTFGEVRWPVWEIGG